MAAMDETTFQHELCGLKERVSEMADSPSPSPAQISGFMLSSAVQNDLFVSQLRDVRTRLDIMQMQASLTPPAQSQEEAPSPLQSTTDLSRSEAFQFLITSVQGLHHNVERCHRDTSDRFDRLERAISGLRGAVLFTPTASETTIEDLTTSQHTDYYESTDLPEPKSDASVHDFLVQQNELDRPATLSQVLEETWTGHNTMPPPLMAICPPKLDGGAELLSDVLNASATSTTLNDPHNVNLVADYGDDFEGTPRDIVETQNTVPDDIARIAKGLTHEIDIFEEAKKKQTEEFEIRLSAKDAVIAHLNTCRKAADEASQITRTNLETRLAECEDQLIRWKQEADAALGNFDAMARCNRELKAAHDLAVGRMKQELKQCEASRHHFMTKYVDENYRFKWLEQKKIQGEQKLYQRLDECERALRNSEKNRDADIRDAIQSREEELDQLYAFCREETSVVSHQERIIAQGTSILKERDAEIDGLNAALADSESERHHARERASKLKHSLKKRDEEIEDLKCVVREEKDRRRRAEALMRRDADSKTKSKDVRFSLDETRPSRPLAQAADAASNGHAVREQHQWTPQPIRSSMLPHEGERASLWQDNVRSAPNHRFGSASPIDRRRKPDAKHDVIGEGAARDGEKTATQHFDASDNGLQATTHSQRNPQVPPPRGHRAHESTHRGWNPPEAQKDASSSRVIGGRSSHSSMSAQAAANRGSAENGRHALPLDVTWLPPLPARTSAPASASIGKMSSVPNLRAGSNDRAGAISKPASMLELRPHTYHAPSVETEAESAEDRGGSSLLDY